MEKSEFSLTENDIPGAKLLKSIDQSNCASLRRWLLCRGAKTTGKLAELRQRVSYYIKNNLDKKYLRDPDGGLHILKKKAEAGLLEETEPSKLETFPTDGYSTDISKLPNVTFSSIWRFMIDSLDWKKQVSTAKPLLKGYNFFMSNHVLALYQLHKDSKTFIKSQVLPSMKKSMVYKCFIKLSSFGYVLAAKCGCPAGINGRCNHVCATLFLIDSLMKKNAKGKEDNDASCTSKPCKWNVPAKRKGEAVPISAIKFRKHVYDKKIKPKVSSKPTTQLSQKEVKDVNNKQEDVRWSKERLDDLMAKLKGIQDETQQVIGWCHILPQDVPKPPVINKELLSPIKDHPISLAEIKERADKVKRKLMVDHAEARQIEKETRDQSKSDLWHFHRQPRITASKCYRTAVLRDTTSPTKAINDVLYKVVKPTYQMSQGLEMEEELKERYVTAMHKGGNMHLSVTCSGLVVGKAEDSFLAASPDGIVFDSSLVNPRGLLEMKFIQTNKDEPLVDALIRKQMCVHDENGTTMNRKHKYFYQIQQGMYITETNWTDFVVAGSQTTDLYIQRVSFDKVWWDGVKKKLKSFFENYILPELAYPRIKYGLSRFSDIPRGC